MNVQEMLSQIQAETLQDSQLRQRFLATRSDNYPLSSFCSLCRELGCEIYPMDIIAASEDTYAAMKRSTNGGGENSPKLGNWDMDFYEEFFLPLLMPEP